MIVPTIFHTFSNQTEEKFTRSLQTSNHVASHSSPSSLPSVAHSEHDLPTSSIRHASPISVSQPETDEHRILAEFESRYGDQFGRLKESPPIHTARTPSVTFSRTTMTAGHARHTVPSTPHTHYPLSTHTTPGFSHHRQSSSAQYSHALQSAFDLLHSTESSLLASQSAASSEKSRIERELESLTRMLATARQQYDQLQPARLTKAIQDHEVEKREREKAIQQLEQEVSLLKDRKGALEREIDELILSRTERSIELQQIQLELDGFDAIRKECKELLTERSKLLQSNAELKQQHESLDIARQEKLAELDSIPAAHQMTQHNQSLPSAQSTPTNASTSSELSLNSREQHLNLLELKLNDKEKQLELLESQLTTLETTLRARAEKVNEVANSKDEVMASASDEAKRIVAAAQSEAKAILLESQHKSATLLETAANQVAKAETGMQNLLTSAEAAARREAEEVIQAAKNRSEAMMKEATEQIATAETEIHKLLAAAEAKATQIIEQAQANKQAKEAAIEHLLAESQALVKKMLTDSEAGIAAKEAQCRELISAVAKEVEESMADAEARREEMDRQIASKEAELKDLESTVQHLSAQVDELTIQITIKQSTLAQLMPPSTSAATGKTPSLPSVASPSPLVISSPVATRPSNHLRTHSSPSMNSPNSRPLTQPPELTALTFGVETLPSPDGNAHTIDSPSHVNVSQPDINDIPENDDDDDDEGHVDDENPDGVDEEVIEPSTPSRYTFKDVSEDEMSD